MSVYAGSSQADDRGNVTARPPDPPHNATNQQRSRAPVPGNAALYQLTQDRVVLHVALDDRLRIGRLERLIEQPYLSRDARHEPVEGLDVVDGFLHQLLVGGRAQKAPFAAGVVVAQGDRSKVRRDTTTATGRPRRVNSTSTPASAWSTISARLARASAMEYWRGIPRMYTTMYICATRPPDTAVEPTART